MIDLLLPCPFCGHYVDITDGDTLYPTGYVWSWCKDRRGAQVKKYERLYTRDVQGNRHRVESFEDHVWGFHCVETSGGCGAVVEGDTTGEAIARWQRRANFDYINWR